MIIVCIGLLLLVWYLGYLLLRTDADLTTAKVILDDNTTLLKAWASAKHRVTLQEIQNQITENNEFTTSKYVQEVRRESDAQET